MERRSGWTTGLDWTGLGKQKQHPAQEDHCHNNNSYTFPARDYFSRQCLCGPTQGLGRTKRQTYWCPRLSQSYFSLAYINETDRKVFQYLDSKSPWWFSAHVNILPTSHPTLNCCDRCVDVSATFFQTEFLDFMITRPRE